MADTTSPTFESQLSELEQLVKTLEQPELPLNQALETFQKGVTLIQSCQKTLHEAEHTIEQLTQTHEALNTQNKED